MSDQNFDGLLNPAGSWADVPELSPAAWALGGPAGPMNAQALALAARTNFLAAQVAAVVAGNSLHSGAGAPDNSLGANGDFYIDTAATALYGPKLAGAWPAGISLVGPAGSGGFSSVQSFPAGSGQSFTVPAGVTKLHIEAWGPGESGQGGGNVGGSSGCYVFKLAAVTPGDVLQINVGSGGIASSGAQNPGTDTTITAGTWGITAGCGNAINGGGTMTATGGDLNLLGELGQYISGNQPNGSSAPRGGTGGVGRPINNGGTGNIPGGGGGAAAAGYNSGAGGDGMVIVRW